MHKNANYFLFLLTCYFYLIKLFLLIIVLVLIKNLKYLKFLMLFYATLYMQL